MLGAIAGDIIGSIYEFDNIKTKDFPLFSDDSEFTDDTILTVAVADTILTGSNYTQQFKQYFQRYPNQREVTEEDICAGHHLTIVNHIIVLEMVQQCALVL